MKMPTWLSHGCQESWVLLSKNFSNSNLLKEIWISKPTILIILAKPMASASLVPKETVKWLNETKKKRTVERKKGNKKSLSNKSNKKKKHNKSVQNNMKTNKRKLWYQLELLLHKNIRGKGKIEIRIENCIRINNWRFKCRLIVVACIPNMPVWL